MQLIQLFPNHPQRNRPMPSDRAIESPQVKEAEQAPTSSLSLPTGPVRTSIPLSAVTRPPIYPHQGHPTKASSTGGSHSAIHSSSGSSSPGAGGHLHKQPKPPNVFSNDGSFLARFQRLKRVRTLFSCLIVYIAAPLTPFVSSIPHTPYFPITSCSDVVGGAGSVETPAFHA
jgi:hypothetical protein